MKRVHIVGGRNHGKTTLVAEIASHLSGRGIRVGTVKHTSHQHPLDKPGKDSYRHREAGGEPAAIISRDTTAVFMNSDPHESVYSRLAPLYADCALVLVEGHLQARDGFKIEVWRKEAASPPLAHGKRDIQAVISDDDPDVPLPVWPRKDVSAIADKLLEWARNRGLPDREDPHRKDAEVAEEERL